VWLLRPEAEGTAGSPATTFEAGGTAGSPASTFEAGGTAGSPATTFEVQKPEQEHRSHVSRLRPVGRSAGRPVRISWKRRSMLRLTLGNS
jgi:hypothetical protein